MATDLEDGLKYQYQLFIDQKERLGFFTGLTDYIEYIFSSPLLKKVADNEWDKRGLEYKKLHEYEQTSIAELEVAKKKLLELIEKDSIDTSNFVQHQSYSALSSANGKKENILEQIEVFEKGDIILGGFYSDNLKDFLSDIATNLLDLGYGDELKDFIVSDSEYRAYYAKINGMSSLSIENNKYGNFIFSETWPLRFQQVALIERQRKMEPWGSFEIIIQIRQARRAVANNLSHLETIQEAKNDPEYPLDGQDSVNVSRAAQDINAFMKNKTLTDTSMGFFKVSDLLPHVMKVHTTLLKGVAGERNGLVIRNSPNTITKKNQQESSDDRWWKNEKPNYKNGVIKLADKECKLLKTAQNQRALCEKLFSRPIGEWLQSFDVDHNFKGETTKRSFYDTGKKLNEKINENFGIPNMLTVTMARICINKNLFE